MLFLFLAISLLDAVSIRNSPHLLDDANEALEDAASQMEALQSLGRTQLHPLSFPRRKRVNPDVVEIIKTPEELAAEEERPVIVGKVLQEPELIKHVIPPEPEKHKPVVFRSKKTNSDTTTSTAEGVDKTEVDKGNDHEVEDSGKIHLDFESDFKTGYRVVHPPKTPGQPAEDPWLNVTTPEEEAIKEEAELQAKIAEQEQRQSVAMSDPNADSATTRDLLLISGLTRKSETLMKQLTQLMSIQGAESTPEVIAEAQKLLKIYTGIKKQISHAVMKYASYHDFEGGFQSSPEILTFPMENPKPPKGQQDVVDTRSRKNSDPHAYGVPMVGGPPETVYTPLEHPEIPVIE